MTPGTQAGRGQQAASGPPLPIGCWIFPARALQGRNHLRLPRDRPRTCLPSSASPWSCFLHGPRPHGVQARKDCHSLDAPRSPRWRSHAKGTPGPEGLLSFNMERTLLEQAVTHGVQIVFDHYHQALESSRPEEGPSPSSRPPRGGPASPLLLATLPSSTRRLLCERASRASTTSTSPLQPSAGQSRREHRWFRFIKCLTAKWSRAPATRPTLDLVAQPHVPFDGLGM